METEEALSIYGWFTASVVFSQIIGALLGDLLLGNKKSIIIGGIIQAIGAFIFCIPSVYGIYVGLFLVVLGNGLFSPNIISNFGKSYLNKPKLLDAGFTLFYLAINIGAFVGALLIGYSGENYSYSLGFLICGLLTLISLIPIIKTKENKYFEKNNVTQSRRVLSIIVAFIVVGLFWGIYEICNIRILDLKINLSESSLFEIPKTIWESINGLIALPFSLIAIIVWTYFYNSQYIKLLNGFVFGIISLGIILFIPEIPSDKHVIYFLISMFFLALSEIHIAPIIHSILTRYSNPKYLAILISLSVLPTQMFAFVFSLFNDKFYDNPLLGLKFGLIAMTIISIGLLVFIRWNKKII